MKTFKLDNMPEFVEDPTIRDIRLEKERQMKKEEEDKMARRLFEKVFLIQIKSYFVIFRGYNLLAN